MVQPHFPAIVTEIESEAEYNGRIHEQTVTIRIPENESVSTHELMLFDSPPKVTEDIIGEKLGLVVSILPSENPTIIDSAERDIKNVESPSSIWSYTFCGELVDCNVTDEWFVKGYERLLLIDIGVGKVLIQPDEDMLDATEAGTFERGDFLCVDASRTEIIQVI